MAEQDRAHNNTAADQLAEPLEQIQQQLTAGSARVAQLRAQWQATLREAKLARAATSDTSWDLADVEQRLRELADQREGPDDLLMEREIARLAGQRVQLEERVLAQLLLVDELNSRVQIEEQALASAEADWALREKVLITERDQLEEGHRTS